jgi:hypothetical protein
LSQEKKIFSKVPLTFISNNNPSNKVFVSSSRNNSSLDKQVFSYSFFYVYIERKKNTENNRE